MAAVVSGIGAINTVSNWFCCGPSGGGSSPKGSGSGSGSGPSAQGGGNSCSSNEPLTSFIPSFAPASTPISLANEPIYSEAPIPLFATPLSDLQMQPQRIAQGGPIGYKGGGDVQEHHPEFFSEGGLKHTFVEGDGDGTSDSVPAMLANGEFVIPADVVSSLGNGDNKSGAKVMDQFLQTVRSHKRDAEPNKLPPDSKGPLGYLLEAKKKVK
jgi:hypothetical protein